MSKSYGRRRRAAILAKWPPHKQLEAHAEANESPPRKDKLNQMMADLAEIKAAHPKPD